MPPPPAVPTAPPPAPPPPAPAAPSRVLTAKENRVLAEAEAFKKDGNGALAGGFAKMACGLYGKAIGVLEPLVAEISPPSAQAHEEDELVVALASCYSNRSATLVP